MPNRFGMTTVFGSGSGDEHVVKNASANPKPQDVMEEILFMPLKLTHAILTSIFGVKEEKKPLPLPGGMGFKRFTPHGELVQTMKTKQLVQNNIFGAGGSN